MDIKKPQINPAYANADRWSR